VTFGLRLETRDGLEPFEAEIPEASRRAFVEAALGARLRGALDRETAAAWTTRVLESEPDYTYAFGQQASLGIAWYTHLEEGRAREYFERASASDEVVERRVPGFRERFVALVARALGVPLVQRPGYAGPGIHVFAAHGPCAKGGGEVHFDTEGLPVPYLRERKAAYTAVLSLSSVTSGGGLRLWDLPYDGHEDPELSRLREPCTVSYEPGDLVLFESYRLHQIEPFSGDHARVSATCHVARLGGAWVYWF
jgi:hypothetical protein